MIMAYDNERFLQDDGISKRRYFFVVIDRFSAMGKHGYA